MGFFRSAYYRRTFLRLKRDFCPWLDGLPAGPRLLEYKGWMREAARLARNEFLTLHPRDTHSIEMVEDSVARAVIAQDVVAAGSLVRLSPVAAEVLSLLLVGPSPYVTRRASRRNMRRGAITR